MVAPCFANINEFYSDFPVLAGSDVNGYPSLTHPLTFIFTLWQTQTSLIRGVFFTVLRLQCALVVIQFNFNVQLEISPHRFAQHLQHIYP